MKLSKNFSLYEFTRSSTATRKGIKNTPTAIEVVNMSYLCEELLQPIRERFGPVRILSGYRSSSLNKAIGGSKNSQHCQGMAADIECRSVDNLDLFGWIADNCDFDQLILEFYTRGEPLSGWVHVSYDKIVDRRSKSIMTAKRKMGKVQYRNVTNISEV